MKRTPMMISFGAFDEDIYEFLKGQKNASALIRKLVRDYMLTGSTGVTRTIETPKQVEQSVEVETQLPKTEASIEAVKINKQFISHSQIEVKQPSIATGGSLPDL